MITLEKLKRKRREEVAKLEETYKAVGSGLLMAGIVDIDAWFKNLKNSKKILIRICATK
jgi:hypothetical protein